MINFELYGLFIDRAITVQSLKKWSKSDRNNVRFLPVTAAFISLRLKPSFWIHTHRVAGQPSIHRHIYKYMYDLFYIVLVQYIAHAEYASWYVNHA